MVDWEKFKGKLLGRKTETHNLGSALGTYEEGLKAMDVETLDKAQTKRKKAEEAEEARRAEAAAKKARDEKVAKARKEAAQKKLEEEARKLAERLEEWERNQERARIELAATLLLIQHLEDEARARARARASEAAPRGRTDERMLLADSQDLRPKERDSGAAARELANLLKKKKQAQDALNAPKPWK